MFQVEFHLFMKLTYKLTKSIFLNNLKYSTHCPSANSFFINLPLLSLKVSLLDIVLVLRLNPLTAWACCSEQLKISDSSSWITIRVWNTSFTCLVSNQFTSLVLKQSTLHCCTNLNRFWKHRLDTYCGKTLKHLNCKLFEAKQWYVHFKIDWWQCVCVWLSHPQDRYGWLCCEVLTCGVDGYGCRSRIIWQPGADGLLLSWWLWLNTYF